jgi:hypothetical protein
MALCVTVAETADRTVIRVDGRLADEGVAELELARRCAKRPTVLDLTNLVTADDTGVVVLRRLVRQGANGHAAGDAGHRRHLESAAAHAGPGAPPRAPGRRSWRKPIAWGGSIDAYGDVRITMAEAFGIAGRAFYEETGAHP